MLRSSSHGRLSKPPSGVFDSLYPEISSRTAGMMWKPEHNIHDGVSIKDFVEHVFHVTPKQTNAILLKDWGLDAEILEQYEVALSASPDVDPSSAFEVLVTDLAQRVSNTIDGNFDTRTLSTHLQSLSVTSAPSSGTIIAKPTDEEHDNELPGSDADSHNMSPTSDIPPISILPSRPVTSVDLQLITHAAEALNVAGCHYTTCTAVRSYFITLWYYDRTCMVRTIEFDCRRQCKDFALFAYGLSHNPALLLSAGGGLSYSLDERSQPGFTSVGTKLTIRPDASRQHNAIFTIIDTIYACNTLIGRGTKVFLVTPDSSGGDSTNEQVLKLVWPNTSRSPETKLIETIIAAVPQWQAHLPKITFSATFSANQLLPRPHLLRTLPSKSLYDRYLHAIAMPKYQKLWELSSVEEFQDVFVDCVECHFHSYEEGKVLHCDLSDNNLMYKRDCVSVKGVLNDWDLATPVDDNGDVPPSTKNYAIGTMPFMAYDLLGGSPPAHLYRHDLESFMYILVWAATHYDFTAKQRLPITSPLASWDHTSYRVARQAKGAFLFDPYCASTIFQNIRPEFRHILNKWIMPLHALFSSAIASTPKDIRTFDGCITFQTFMGVLGRRPR